MKQRFFFGSVCVWILLALPARADVKENRFLPGNFLPDSVLVPQQDDKSTKKKDKDSQKDTEADKSKEPQQDPKADANAKPVIKEVPKARPKLRPAAVTDKIKIKRPPVKVKTGLIRSIKL